MKEQILNAIKITLDKIKTFSKEHPKTALFVFGIIVGLIIAFVF